jgi:hypothetical protein
VLVGREEAAIARGLIVFDEVLYVADAVRL